jgi:alanine-glyoxylate transaminase/serine-glyoxylate transaminase/serine-pyruvate transaminase
VSETLPERLLLGPGPSNVSARVRAALGRPLLGHLDPAFLAILDETQAALRAVFRTTNGMTLPISGTGSAGREACLVNLLEPGDEIVVGVNGVFGERLAAMALRCGARPVRVEAKMGESIPPERLAAAIREKRPRAVALVHAETSTGVAQRVATACSRPSAS